MGQPPARGDGNRRSVNPGRAGTCRIIDSRRCRRPCPKPAARMNSTVNLTDLQLAIVRILWERGECTVLEVQEALAPERKLAQTTVATILTRLEKRKIVRHQSKGRLFVYKALVTEPQVRRSMVSDLTALLFDGSPAALISHLIAEKEIKASDLDEVKRLIADAERRGHDAAR
jgi:BlaI family transcriptional regulator, penicillinase repressor